MNWNMTDEQKKRIVTALVTCLLAIVAVLTGVTVYDQAVIQPREAKLMPLQGVPDSGAVGAQAAGGATQLRGLTVIGASKLNSTLTVAGASSFTGASTHGTGSFTSLDVSGAFTAITSTWGMSTTEPMTTTSSLYAASLAVPGATVLDGGLTMDTNKFTVANTSGNTLIAGSLAANGGITGDVGITMTTGNVIATAGDIRATAGSLTVGNGTPTVTQNGEDGYIEGTFEVDGAVRFDSALAMGAVTFSGPIKFGCAASISSGGTIAHGLATTPTHVTLTGYGATITTTPYISALDTTSITVKFLAAEADAMSICWDAGK